MPRNGWCRPRPRHSTDGQQTAKSTAGEPVSGAPSPVPWSTYAFPLLELLSPPSGSAAIADFQPASFHRKP